MTDSHISLSYLPGRLGKSLTKFQRKGVRFGIRKNGRLLIADEMGLGKTLQAISIAYYYKQKWPLLIIVPSSLRYNWVNELEDWLPFLQPGDINMIRSFADVNSMRTALISIISYGLISFTKSKTSLRISDVIRNTKFGVAIVDESHYIKNFKSVRTREIMAALKNISHVILLSGTPSLSRPVELYSQLSLLNRNLFGDFYAFTTRYCMGHHTTEKTHNGRVYNSYNTRGASNLEELHRKLVENIMVRRLKSQVLTELPAKRRSKIVFEIADSNKYKNQINSQFESMCQVIRKMSNPEEMVSAFDYHQPFTRLFCNTAFAKAGAVQQYITDLLEGMPNKFLVFTYHLSMVKAVQQTLVQKKVQHICITGSVPSSERGAMVERFQTDAQCRVAVLSLQAASTGLTLTAADHVVFAELHHTPGVLMQAEDRCHRIGQHNAVQIHYLVAHGTIDEILWAMLQRKVAVTSVALNGKVDRLAVDHEDYSKKDLLSLVETWEPCFAEAETSQLFEQADRRTSKDIRGYFTSRSSNEPKKRKKHAISVDSICSEDEGAFCSSRKRLKKREDESLLFALDRDDVDTSRDIQQWLTEQPTETKGEELHDVLPNETTSKWSCPRCTFLNHGDLIVCEMCRSTSMTLRSAGPPRESNLSMNNTLNNKDTNCFEDCSKTPTRTNITPLHVYTEKVCNEQDIACSSKQKTECNIDITERTISDASTLSVDTSDTCSDIESFTTCSFSEKLDVIVETSENEDEELVLNEIFNEDFDVTSLDENYDALFNDDIDASLIREINDSDVDSICDDNDDEIKDVVKLQYCLSYYTNKVFLYDQDGTYLRRNFNVQSIGMGVLEGLHPNLLRPDMFGQLKHFASEWKNLGLRKQSLIRRNGQLFTSPNSAYTRIYQSTYGKSKKSYKRFTGKEDEQRLKEVASKVGGSVITSKKKVSKKKLKEDVDDDFEEEVVQALDSEGHPMCLYCSKRVLFANEETRESRFCSHVCMEEFKIRRKSRYYNARQQLFLIEQGVCQVCGTDAHAIYLQVVNAPAAVRKPILEKTIYAKLTVPMLNKMVKIPKEGLFWEADHVIAVAEGGGECGLENYRTLCTPCHRKVTQDLRKRLKKSTKVKKDFFDGNKK